jgi:hypothetical protein
MLYQGLQPIASRDQRRGDEWDGGVIEQVAKNGGREVKGEVRHHAEGGARQSICEHVGLADGDAWRGREPAPQRAGERWIGLDGGDRRAMREEGRGQQPPSGSDVEDVLALTDPRRVSELAAEAWAAQEVLREAGCGVRRLRAAHGGGPRG